MNEQKTNNELHPNWQGLTNSQQSTDAQNKVIQNNFPSMVTQSQNKKMNNEISQQPLNLNMDFNIFSKQNLTYIFSGLAALVLIVGASIGLKFIKLPSQNLIDEPSNYSPFKPEPKFEAAIKLLPVNKDLAVEKLNELQKSLSPANDARRQYILAQISQRAGNYREAYEQYASIRTSLLPYLADRILLHKAETAAEIGQEKIVLDSCRNILRFHANSLSVPAAHYELGRSFVRQSSFKEAEKEFNKVRTNYPSSQQAIGAAYYLGRLSEDKNEKNKLWEEYLSASPDGRFADEILNAWTKDLNALSNRQKTVLALSYIKQNKKPENADLMALLATELNELNWYALAQTQLDAKQKVLAQKTLFEGLKRFPNNDDFRNGFNLLLRNSSIQEREVYVEELLAKGSPEDNAYMLWRLAAFNTAKRKEILQRLRDKYPNSTLSAPSSAEIFWEYYKAGQLDAAESFGQAHIAKYGNLPEGDKFAVSNGTAKVLFWLGKKAELNGDLPKAKSLYNQLLTAHSTSYYAFRAQGRLQFLNGGTDPGWTLPKDYRLASSLLESESLGSPDLQTWVWPLPRGEVKQLHTTLQELFALNLWQEAVSLMPDKYEKKYPALRAWIMARVEEKVAEAINLAALQLNKRKSSFDADHDYWMIGYPFVYFDYTLRSGMKYDLDPLLMQGLMRQESRFQHKVVSRSNAIGLCQLLPGTAKEVAKSISYPTPDFDMLCNPEYNVELGTKYLSGLNKQFNGNTQLAVAAYNAGPGSVGKWLKANPNADPDLFVELIPYQETQKYVVNVFENYWVYKNLIQHAVDAKKYANVPKKEKQMSSMQEDFGVDYPSTVK